LTVLFAHDLPETNTLPKGRTEVDAGRTPIWQPPFLFSLAAWAWRFFAASETVGRATHRARVAAARSRDPLFEPRRRTPSESALGAGARTI
jgi:hypothetical protein